MQLWLNLFPPLANLLRCDGSEEYFYKDLLPRHFRFLLKLYNGSMVTMAAGDALAAMLKL